MARGEYMTRCSCEQGNLGILRGKVPDSQWRGRMFESYLQMQQIYVFQHRLRIGIQKGVGVPDF